MSFFQSLFGGGVGGGVGSRVTGAEARKLVAEGAQLVDVRSPGEFAGGSVPGAKNIPVDQLGGRLAELDAKKTVIVFCRSGARSASAAQLLAQRGFADVKDLGTVGAW
jgi:rhodanese-related sulfurtransferase